MMPQKEPERCVIEGCPVGPRAKPLLLSVADSSESLLFILLPASRLPGLSSLSLHLQNEVTLKTVVNLHMVAGLDATTLSCISSLDCQ